MKNLFTIIPEDFFKPLCSKYKKEYVECIELIFNSFKPEISYGVDREVILTVLEDYFGTMAQDMILDDNEVLSDARAKANAVIKGFKDSGWLEYEQGENHSIQVTLFDYAIPIIESFNKIVKEEEAEYQSIISGIYARLQNQEGYHKPYELIIKGVSEDTDHLVSELKRLNISIKRHMEKQTNQMSAGEILEHFFQYHRDIGSRAYLRMKTSDNVAYFRSAIIEKLEAILSSSEMMKDVMLGYMEIEQEKDESKAYDEVVQIILGIKSAFFRLDEIIAEIDRKHARYQKNAVMRAKFLLSTGNNMEGKISQILGVMVKQLNEETEHNIYEEAPESWMELFHLYPQGFIDNESQRTIPVTRKFGGVDDLGSELQITEEERAIYKEAFMEKNRTRFSRKNINAYVGELLEGKERLKASTIPIANRRDMIRIIYISLYGNNRANCYTVERSRERIKVAGFEFPDFDIVRAEGRI
jgi:hypothetical protein